MWRIVGMRVSCGVQPLLPPGAAPLWIIPNGKILLFTESALYTRLAKHSALHRALCFAKRDSQNGELSLVGFQTVYSVCVAEQRRSGSPLPASILLL